MRMSAEIAPSVVADIDRAPKEPGCYLFKGADGSVLYVGKAKLLRHRIRSYLRPNADGRLRIPYMVREAMTVEYVVTATEKEALVLENNLIKLHKPTYNIALRDDRTYVSMRIDLRHEWPRATVVHKYKKDGATYVGPFASAGNLRQTLEALKRVFPLRRCSDHVLRNRNRVCVYYDIGVCAGPCVDGLISKEEYRNQVDGLVKVLQGKDAGVVAEFEAKMMTAASEQNFELAAKLRDQLFAIRATVESQNAQISGKDSINRDVIGIYREGEYVQLHVLLYRDSRLVGSSTHAFGTSLPDDELIEQFAQRYYEGDHTIPPEVLLPIQVDDPISLGAYISDKAGFSVDVQCPQRGEKAKLTSLANLNAKHAMRDRDSKREETDRLLISLQEKLGLENVPRRMECYDISHFQGAEIVGSRVTFVDGAPEKKLYRRYKLKTVTSNDDFASMKEVLDRRIARGLKDMDFPDVIVIDGGPQQLSKVKEIFDEYNIIDVDLISLAKSRDKSGPASRSNYSSKASDKVTDERVFVPGSDEPITLDQKSQEIFLLMRLRDEAHRFAITYNRERRRKVALTSGLDAIPGVGPKRKRALIRAFGSPAQVKKASVEELCAVDGMTQAMAQTVWDFFEAQGKEEPAGE